MNPALLSPTPSHAAAVQVSHWPVEAFAIVDAWGLMRGEPLPAGVRPRAAWRQACADVARDPLQLEAHARRVLLACLARERVHVFDALVDCFLALGARGHSLREALLEHARLWLDDERYDFLARHLPAGLSPQDPLPTHGTSLLDPGLIGLPVVVRQLQPLPFDAQAEAAKLPPELAESRPADAPVPASLTET